MDICEAAKIANRIKIGDSEFAETDRYITRYCKQARDMQGYKNGKDLSDMHTSL